MQVAFKVNQIKLAKAKVLWLFLAMSAIGCTTLNQQDPEEAKLKEIYEHQIGIIINHLNIGEPEKAHFESRSLLKQYPERAEVHNLMGLSFMGLRKANLAEKNFRKAFDLKPDPAFGLNITSALIEQRNFREAIKLLKRFKKEGLKDYRYPERFDHNLGLSFERINKPKTATKYYRKALASNPSNFQTLMQLGRLYQKRSMIKRAEPIFKRASNVCLRCYEPVKRRSDILIRMGRKQEAVRLLVDFVETQDLREEDRQLAKRYVSKLDPSLFNTNNGKKR